MDILLYVLLAAAANVAGGLLILMKRTWSERDSYALMALSAGLLFAIAIMAIMPEAIELHESSPIFIILGFGLFFLIQQLFSSHNHSVTSQRTRVILFGMLLHTFLDGVSIVMGFHVDKAVGLVVLFAVLLHKVPDGLTLSSIIYAKTRNRRKAVNASWLLGLSTIAGAAATMAASQFFDAKPVILPIALSLTAGMFLYIVTIDLLPAVRAIKDRSVSIYFFYGILLYIGLHQVLDLLPFHIH
ncbi:MAG: ZIP family metal transporter [Lysinibacillus sp.]